MCTSFVGCKTILTVILTVMSGMNSHMISWDLIWLGLGFGWNY
jgi:hypothetical protein